MLDIRFIRDNPDLVRRGAQLKNTPIELDRLLALDGQRRVLQQKLQELVTEQNRLSKELGPSMGPLMGQIKKEKDAAKKAQLEAQVEQLKARPAALKAEGATLEVQLKELEPAIEQILLTIPQPPDDDVPVGKSSDDNVEIGQWGAPRTFDFAPKNHVELGQKLGLFDAERGVRMAGSRSYFLTGAGAMLAQAVMRMAFDLMVYEHGFEPLIVPVMVREAAMRGTGFFPAGREQAYRVGEVTETGDDELFLTGTGEVGLTAFHWGEILAASDLPRKLTTWSTCFRREAGTYGKDTTGLYRVHQFDKVEQVVLCAADKDESKKWQRTMLGYSEEMLKRLELPYRLMQCCTGDLGPKNASMIDIETWMPSRGAYSETHSASRLYDFQARRCNIRYKDAAGKVQFVHTLNNTVIATPRILIPIVENHQNADGSVTIPAALRKYMNGMERIDPR